MLIKKLSGSLFCLLTAMILLMCTASAEYIVPTTEIDVYDDYTEEDYVTADYTAKEIAYQFNCYIRLTVEEVPFGAAPCVSGLRVFGNGKGRKPDVPSVQAVRTGDLDFTVSAKAGGRPLGFNILWGYDENHLYHSCLVMGEELRDRRIGALMKDRPCAVRVDAFNENGITQGTAMTLA